MPLLVLVLVLVLLVTLTLALLPTALQHWVQLPHQLQCCLMQRVHLLL